ncbi:MAG: HEAT repeat domain-containing protein [Deltaproteobacteria bacterium]|nr:HEAT repeat domain-containing protein [Deltaproteobacteria bacterium]
MPCVIGSRVASLIVSALLLAFVAPSAHAQQPGRTPPVARRGRPAATAQTEPGRPVPTIADLPRIAAGLSSTNADQVREAIDLLSVIDRPEVIPHLAQLLRSGPPDVVTDRAIDALGGLGHPDGIDVLLELTHHRRPGARRKAYAALAQIRDPRIPTLLEAGLRDSDRGVRGQVALSFGEIGARQSVAILFRAFERGVLEAATSIGKLGGPDTVERLAGYLGQQPLSVLLSGFREYLLRSDISDRVKLDIVARLVEVAGPQVREMFQRLVQEWPAPRGRGTDRVRAAMQDAVRRIPDGPARTGTRPAGTAPTPPAPSPPATAPAGGAR